MQNSALSTSSKQRRLVSEVWNDFKRVEVDGKHRAICNHCRRFFSGSSKSGTTHLKNHLSRCPAIQRGESSKRRRSASKVWNDFERIEVDGKRRALCTHCHKHFPGSSKSGTTHLKNHLSRCSAIKIGESYKNMISSSKIGDLKNPTVINGNSVFDEESSDRDNEYSPELTQNSFVLPGASLSFEPQEEHAPHSSNMEFMLANPSSTSCPEPGPTGHSSFISAGTSSCLELQEKHAPSSANMESMLTNLSSTSCSEPLPISHTSFASAGTSLGLESQEEHASSSANMKLIIANHSSTSCPVPLPTGYSSFVLAGTSSSLKPQEKHAPSSANTECMLAYLSSTSCSEPLPTGHSSFVSAGTSSILEPQEKHGCSSANMELMLANHNSTLCPWSFPTGHSSFDLAGTSLSLEAQEKHAPSSANTELMLADAQNLVISAFEHSGEVVPFDDETSLVGSSSHLTNVLYTSSSPRTESSNGSKVLASHKFGGFNYTQQRASSPDIISSIYAVRGLDYSLHTINGMGLRYEQALSFPESMNHSFDVDHLNFFDTDLLTQNHLNFFDTDLLTQSVNLESQSDPQTAVETFISARAAIMKAQTRWTKLFSMLKWFSIIVVVRRRVREIPRFRKIATYNNGVMGTGMSPMTWEVNVERTRKFLHEQRMFLYRPPSSQQKTGVVFGGMGQVMGQLSECQYVPIDKLSETEKGEVVSFDDEASIVGSSSYLTNVLNIASSPRMESSNGCKFLASHKIGGFDYAQQSASYDIDSVGGSSGLEDFALHGIDSMGLRYEQALSFPESMNHSFDDDYLNFFDTDLLT